MQEEDVKKKQEADITELDLIKAGKSNGPSVQLVDVLKEKHRSLNEKEKDKIIKEAAKHYGRFLTALGVDYENDPNAFGTPERVAKAYVYDIWKGRYNVLDPITSFPSDYQGMIVETNIPIFSQCAHHHQSIQGVCHVGYLPGKSKFVIGLSKLNRIVEHFSRRGQIQEDLTMQIFNAISKAVPDNAGVAVVIDSKHSCVSCRGVKHQGASMQTAKLDGAFMDEPSCKEEFYMHVQNAVNKNYQI